MYRDLTTLHNNSNTNNILSRLFRTPESSHSFCVEHITNKYFSLPLTNHLRKFVSIKSIILTIISHGLNFRFGILWRWCRKYLSAQQNTTNTQHELIHFFGVLVNGSIPARKGKPIKNIDSMEALKNFGTQIRWRQPYQHEWWLLAHGKLLLYRSTKHKQ